MTSLRIPDVAWISQGRLYIKRVDSPVTEIESDFANNALQREQRQSQNSAWKDRSGVWGSMGMEPPGTAPWANVAAKQQRQIRFVTAARGNTADEIYYVLDMGAVGGLFKLDLERDEETRLMHSQGFQARDLSRRTGDGQIAVSVLRDDGTMGLSINRHDGLFGKSVTMSDTIDEAPSWLPDGSARLLFQSSAIARNDDGYAVGQSTYRVEQMDLDEQKITMLHEDEGHDLLQPRMTDDESVLFVRRPYRLSHRQQPTLWEVAQDVLLFPFRLLRAIIYFFNFLSMAFSGKPLMTSGGPEQQNKANRPLMMLYGQAIDTQHAMAKRGGNDSDKPLVPQDWELVAVTKAGHESVLATNVTTFDCTHAGEIVYSDGRKLFHRAPDGTVQEITQADAVEKVVILS